MIVYQRVEEKNDVNIFILKVKPIDINTLPDAVKTGLLTIGCVGDYFTAYNAFVFSNRIYGEDERGYKFSYHKGRKWSITESAYKTVHDLYIKGVTRNDQV